MRLIPRQPFPRPLPRLGRRAPRPGGDSRSAVRRTRLLPVAGAVVVTVLAAPPAVAQPEVLAAEESLGAVLDNIRNWVMGIVGALATVMVSIGGLMRMMAAGDPGEIERSNRAFKAAAWGYGIVALAPLVVEILQGIVGE